MASRSSKSVSIGWTGEDGIEHVALSKVLRMYIDLYTEGKAGSIVEGVMGIDDCEKNNGVEAWRLLTESYDPKNAAQAMQIQRAAMKLGEAKSNEEIWEKILELEKLERSFTANHKEKKGFDEMTKTCIMHQILPDTISQQILTNKSIWPKRKVILIGSTNSRRGSKHFKSGPKIRGSSCGTTLRNCKVAALGFEWPLVRKRSPI